MSDYAALDREKRGLEEMLFLVLEAVGEPVTVSKEQMTRGSRPDMMINIEDDIDNKQFIFSISKVSDAD